jgi:RNA polymerase subunit RPABC4/transcription elongation factor Spt4
MSSFRERLKSVPVPAWVVGLLISILLVVPLWLGPMSFDHEMREWPTLAKVGLLTLPPIFIVAYSALVGFIYADARRRRMRHVFWAWLALVPYFIGVILYFILRDPLPTPCPKCGMAVPQAFAFCPGCGASRHPICSQCGKTLQQEWANCPHCGNRIAPSGAPASS